MVPTLQDYKRWYYIQEPKINYPTKSISISVKCPHVPLVSKERIAREEAEGSVLNDNYTAIKDLRPGQEYRQNFMVSKVHNTSRMKTGQGVRFARVSFKDVTDEINGTLWGYEDGSIKTGDYINAKIKVRHDGNSGEWIFSCENSSIQPATDIHEELYAKQKNVHVLNAYAEEVQDKIMSVDDPIYRDILGNAVERLELIHALRSSPYGLTGPMAYQGGLLVHVAHALRLTDSAVSQARGMEVPFSASLVVAGCVLRRPLPHRNRKGGNQIHRSSNAFNGIRSPD